MNFYDSSETNIKNMDRVTEIMTKWKEQALDNDLNSYVNKAYLWRKQKRVLHLMRG